MTLADPLTHSHFAESLVITTVTAAPEPRARSVTLQSLDFEAPLAESVAPALPERAPASVWVFSDDLSGSE